MTAAVKKTDTKLIELSNLHVNFKYRQGTVRAVKEANLDIFSGESLGLVGESGSGKSVTAQSILGIIPTPGEIAEGEIYYFPEGEDGKRITLSDLKSKGKEFRHLRARKFSIIFQEPMSALSPIHTIGNQIIEAMMLARSVNKKEARNEAVKLLRKVGIPKAEERIDEYTFNLSGGMRQRAMIAMALAGEPEFLIADEPTTAIDVTIQAQILELLENLQKDFGMSLMMITHDLGVIAAVAERVAVMYNGYIVEKAFLENIFNNPLHPYTKGLINSIPDIKKTDRKLVSIEGVVPHPYARIKGCDFRPRCEKSIEGICDQSFPSEIECEKDHFVRCYLYNELEDDKK